MKALKEKRSTKKERPSGYWSGSGHGYPPFVSITEKSGRLGSKATEGAESFSGHSTACRVGACKRPRREGTWKKRCESIRDGGPGNRPPRRPISHRRRTTTSQTEANQGTKRVPRHAQQSSEGGGMTFSSSWSVVGAVHHVDCRALRVCGGNGSTGQSSRTPFALSALLRSPITAPSAVCAFATSGHTSECRHELPPRHSITS